MSRIDHAFLAPSSAGIWGPGGCPASPTVEAQYPEQEDSEKAREGTAAHEVAATRLIGGIVEVGDITSNGVVVDQDMIDGTDAYVADTLRLVANASQGSTFHVEQRVTVATVHLLNEGTPDAYLVDPVRRTIHLSDFKYGHRYVDVFENWQLLDYLCGVVDALGLDNSALKRWQFALSLYQPRNYHPSGPVRYWELDGEELIEYRDRLRDAAVEATTTGAPMRTGAHCRDCRGRADCAALHMAGGIAIDVAHAPQLFALPPAQLGQQLALVDDAIKRLGALKTGLEEQGLETIRRGTDVPGWKAEHAQGRAKWTATVDEVAALGGIYGVDLMKPPEPITPVQARAKGVDDAVIQAMSIKPSGALTLARFTDADMRRQLKRK